MAGVHLDVNNARQALEFSHKSPNYQVKDRTLFTIHCWTGKCIRVASGFEHESEVLIRPFRVIKIDPGEADPTLYSVQGRTQEELKDP